MCQKRSIEIFVLFVLPVLP